MRKIFCIIFVLVGVNVFANPGIRYNETMGWMGKNENDVVKAGGILKAETDLNLGYIIKKLKVFKIDTPEGYFGLHLLDGIVDHVEYWNTIVYSSKNEFNREVERIQNLVQSLNGKLTSNYNTKTDNTKTYKAIISNIYEVAIDIYSYNSSDGLGVFDGPSRFGTYIIKINRK
jgi:hypothetical protein